MLVIGADMDKVTLFLALCLATSGASLTISKSKGFNGVREWFSARVPVIGALLGCPYCLSHWFAFGLILACGLPTEKPVLYVLVGTFAIVGMSAIITGAIIRLMFIHEAENDRLRAALKMARERLAEVAEQ